MGALRILQQDRVRPGCAHGGAQMLENGIGCAPGAHPERTRGFRIHPETQHWTNFCTLLQSKKRNFAQKQRTFANVQAVRAGFPEGFEKKKEKKEKSTGSQAAKIALELGLEGLCRLCDTKRFCVDIGLLQFARDKKSLLSGSVFVERIRYKMRFF